MYNHSYDGSSAKLTEEQKLQDDYLKSEIDYSIHSCVTSSNDKLQRAYDLRNGVRSEDKFQYLWQAYGIEFPSQMRHIPVLRSMFDVLSGQELSQPLHYTLTCSDSDSLSSIQEEKHRAILDEINEAINRKLEDNARKVSLNRFRGQNNMEPQKPTLSDKFLNDLQENYENNWKSSFEIAGQDAMEYLIQKKKLRKKFNTIFEDIITSGRGFYQSKVVRKNADPYFRVLNPINFFYAKDQDTDFVKDCTRAVYKEMMHPADVLQRFGHLMKKEDKAKFLEDYYKISEGEMEIVDGKLYEPKTGRFLDADRVYKSIGETFVPVYNVEWKANTEIEYDDLELTFEGKSIDGVMERKSKKKYRLDLYQGIRIGDCIYVEMGRAKYPRRPVDDPSYCYLTFNGACYSDRNGEPYSLVLKTEDIADKIDIMHYHWENLVATSGTKGITVNFPDIPVWMGDDPVERAMKWLGYAKQGMNLIDTSQGGQSGKFNNMGYTDLSISQSIAILWEGIRQLEETASSITGVSRQRRGDLKQSDGKGTTEIAVTQSTYTTQPLYFLHGEIIKEALTDLLNDARIAYSDGMKGSYLIGDRKQKIFTIDADKMMAEFNVFVSDSGEELRAIQEFKDLTANLVTSNIMDLSDVLEVYTTKSLTVVKDRINKARKKKQNDQTEQLQSQLEELDGQNKQLASQVEMFQKKDADNKNAEIQLKAQESQETNSIERERLSMEKLFRDRELDNDSKRIELEALQLAYTSGNNKEVKDK